MINKKQFKKDFNTETNVLSNKELLEKYNFKSIKEMCDYARKNDLIIIKKKTQQEIKDLKKYKRNLIKKAREKGSQSLK